MSNTTRTRVRPVHRVSLDATKSVPLRVLFGGVKGLTLLREALQATPETLRQPGFEEARSWLAWEKQPARSLGEEAYRLTLAGAQLHPHLRAAGCQHVEIDLTVTPSVAKVRSRARYTTHEDPKTAEAEEGLARTSHRAINTLGAFAFTIPLLRANIAEKVRQKLAPQRAMQQTERQRVAARRTTQRQLAFQQVAIAPNNTVQSF